MATILPLEFFGSSHWDVAAWVVPVFFSALGLVAVVGLILIKLPRPVPPATEDDDPFTFP